MTIKTERVTWFQNSHILLLNPSVLDQEPNTGARATYREISTLRRLADLSEKDVREENLGGRWWAKRLPRTTWAFSTASGVITGLRMDASLGYPAAEFTNETAEVDADLSTHRFPGHESGAGGHLTYTKELMFEGTCTTGTAVLGIMHREKLVRAGLCDPLPWGGSDVAVLMTATDKPLVDVGLKKFTYDTVPSDLASAAQSAKGVVAAYRAIGCSDDWIRGAVAEPIVRAVVDPSVSGGYNMLAGTITIPAAVVSACRPDAGGQFALPLYINVDYGSGYYENGEGRPEQRDYHYYCCRVDAIDPKLSGPSGYLLLVAEVIEGSSHGGANGEESSLSAVDAIAMGVDELVSLAAPGVEKAKGGDAPGEEEEIAQEIVSTLQDGYGTTAMIATVQSVGWFKRYLGRPGASASDYSPAAALENVEAIVRVVARARAILVGKLIDGVMAP